MSEHRVFAHVAHTRTHAHQHTHTHADTNKSEHTYRDKDDHTHKHTRTHASISGGCVRYATVADALRFFKDFMASRFTKQLDAARKNVDITVSDINSLLAVSQDLAKKAEIDELSLVGIILGDAP